MSDSVRSFLAIDDLSRQELLDLIEYSIRLKEQTSAGVCPQFFSGKMAGLIFHKPSLRTRISFETGVMQLGGGSIFITDQEIQLGVRESIADAAKVLSRYLDVIVIRTYHQSDIEELAREADIPIINALTDKLHPCQIFCDLLTIREKFGRIEGLKLSYFGDGNNMARSWINAAKLLDIDLWIATSADTHPGKKFVEDALETARGRITITDNPAEAADKADILYTDVWASMGEKSEAAARADSLKALQINEKLLQNANPNSIVMHCLPAERGKEITDAVMDGAKSVVFDQAENRLHGQKTILLWTLGEI